MSKPAPRFGTAGLSDSARAQKVSSPAQIAAYTAGFGLNAFEYQCGRGVRISAERAAALGKACAEKDIALSVHAPYYISMSSWRRKNGCAALTTCSKAAPPSRRWAAAG